MQIITFNVADFGVAGQLKEVGKTHTVIGTHLPFAFALRIILI